jgi:FtsZ-binding cell division protein ZapB
MIKNKTKIIENVNDTVKMLQIEIKSLKKTNEELTKKIDELTKENEENKKNLENLSKKYKSNNKKSRDLEDKIRQELVSEFRKTKGTGGEKPLIPDLDQDGELQNYNSFVSKNDLKQLFDKINHVLSLEELIQENFNFLDMKNVSSIDNFLVQKEIYSNELRNQIDELINNKEIFADIKNSDVLKDKMKIFTLTQENKRMLQENNVYKSIADFFVLQTNIEEKKESLSKDIIKQFIDTNKDLIEFYKKNLDVNNEYLIVQKSFIEKLKFQIEELKLQDERNNKMIDSIQNENFLLTMELSKYKENSKSGGMSGEKNSGMLDIKKSIFMNDNDLPDTKKELNLENDEFNNLLQTKESEEFANRLRASVLGNSTLGQSLTINTSEQSDKKENI